MTLCSSWGSYPTWNVSHIPSQLLKGISQSSNAVGEHMDPSFAITTPWCIDLDLESQLESSIKPIGYKWCHCVVVEALTHQGMFPTSPPQHIQGVLDNVHVLQTYLCIHNRDITTNAHGNPDVGEVSWNLYNCWAWASKDAIVQWLRLLLNMEWLHYNNIPSQHIKGVW